MQEVFINIERVQLTDLAFSAISPAVFNVDAKDVLPGSFTLLINAD
jgi:hypothetical protein